MAGTPFFKFTVFNEALYPDGIVINHPMGWFESLLKLERHKDFHSLVEFFESSFLWYGSGREVILAIEDDQGVDAKIRLLAQIRFNGEWDTIFDGQLDVSQIEDFAKANTFYKSKLPIIRDDFWSKIINRMKRTVDVAGTVDVEGAAITPLVPFTLPLPSQKIRLFSHYIEPYGSAIRGGASFDTGDRVQVGFNEAIIDEAKTNYNLPTSKNTAVPVAMWSPDNDGTYSFDIAISVSYYYKNLVNEFPAHDPPPFPTSGYDSVSESFKFYFQRNDEDVVEFDFDDSPLIVLKRGTKFFLTINDVVLLKGDQIRIYGEAINDDWDDNPVPDSTNFPSLVIWGKDNSEVSTYTFTNYIIDISGDPWLIAPSDPGYQVVNHGVIPDDLEISYFKVTGDTTYVDTETDAFLIKDVFESVISKITGVENVVQSAFYETCAKLYALMKGLHVRGYSMALKKFFMSLDDIWQIANPLQAIGMGYVDGENKIEIEHISEFYDPDPAINFSNVADLTREYDLDNHYKTVKTGFTKWSAESDSGMDDPQTNGLRFTRFQNFGSEISIMSKGYMASLGIERSRRNRVELGKDDRLDEDTMVIRLTEDSDGYHPELGSQFNTTNLLNPNERYNVRDTPAVIFKRWQAYLQGCLQKYIGDFFKFDGGEGNYVATKEFPEYDCEFPNLQIAEDQDIEVTDDYLFIPKIYKCSIPLDYAQYKTIRQNRKKAIGISKTSSGHVPMFIMELNWRIMAGRADLVLMLGENVKV